MGEGRREALRVDFDRSVKVEFHGANVTSDAGLQTKLIKIGAKVVRHARYTCFQMAEVSKMANWTLKRVRASLPGCYPAASFIQNGANEPSRGGLRSHKALPGWRRWRLVSSSIIGNQKELQGALLPRWFLWAYS